METEESVQKDADPRCTICDGCGWHWGWNQYHQAVMLRCPCVDRRRSIACGIHISEHAVQRYRERIVGCPERQRTDDTLRAAMHELMEGRLPRKFKKTNFIGIKPWGIIVLHRGYVTTALGPLMPESRSLRQA